MDDLPTYESSYPETHSSSHSDTAPPRVLLNLIPEAGQVSFQSGQLGYTPSFLRGSLQLKFTESQWRSSVERVELEFVGIERISGVGPTKATQVELVRQESVLWDRQSTLDTATSSSRTVESGSAAGRSGPAGTLDFEFRLTDDLPHCCHLGSGSIAYHLAATVVFESASETSRTATPVHLSRTSPPSPASDPPPPEIYNCQHPTDVSVYFPHGTSTIRRSESIQLKVRIPPPDSSLVQEKGLKLKSVSAELVRQISVRAGENEGSSEEEIEVIATSSPPGSAAPLLTTVISKSGKAAAFSSLRPIFLNIWLQPVPFESCESISQSTIFHDVRFLVKVVASFMGRDGDRQEVTVVERPITIISDYPERSRERSADSSTGLTHVSDGNRPRLPPRTSPTAFDAKYQPQSSSSGTSTGSSALNVELLRSFEEDVEFDGYEQLSENAGDEEAPPNINEDTPPPPLSDSPPLRNMEAISQRLRSTTAHNDDGQPFQSPPPPHSAALESSSVLSRGDLAPPGEEVPPYTTSPAPAASGPSLAGFHAPLQSSSRRDSFVADRHPASQDQDIAANTSATVPAQAVSSGLSDQPPPHSQAQHHGDEQEQTSQLPPPPYESEGQPSSQAVAGGEEEGRIRRAMREMLRV